MTQLQWDKARSQHFRAAKSFGSALQRPQQPGSIATHELFHANLA